MKLAIQKTFIAAAALAAFSCAHAASDGSGNIKAISTKTDTSYVMTNYIASANERGSASSDSGHYAKVKPVVNYPMLDGNIRAAQSDRAIGVSTTFVTDTISIRSSDLTGHSDYTGSYD